LVWDLVALLSEDVHQGSHVEAVLQGHRGGGAANVAEGIAALGAKARFLGHVGEDALGAQMVDELFRRGVEIRVAHRGRSAMLLCLVTPDGQRSFVIDTGDSTSLFPDDIDHTWLDGAAVLHLSGYSYARSPIGIAMMHLAGQALENGMQVTLDVGSPGCVMEMGIDQYVKSLATLRPSVLFANDDEAKLLGLYDEIPEGVELVVVHRGPSATVALHRTGRFELDVVDVDQVVDITGAGDAFAAGFLVAWQKGSNLIGSMQSGHALAAKVVTKAGAGVDPT
jgi:sugar/nucleoside kinase (ribokinase family)